MPDRSPPPLGASGAEVMLLGPRERWGAERMTDPPREVANVLLDALSAFDPNAANGTQSGNNAAINLALRRLDDVAAITATYNNETDEAAVDVYPLLMGALSLLTILTELIAEECRMDRQALIHSLRAHLETTLPN